ncbi:olfactory receptor 6N1-like [Lepisosteus oculatus]|uniref:olfactory receptor 6N1-like n=1 Tax=Lepisosteus oculatus TaxID=7918 RepID=UPI0003EACC00|nr:PREDICTED: olfactory receptor 6N1-like [Lepisosteus oculatus]
MEINATFPSPVGFLISGLQNLQNSDYYFIFLAFVYLGTLIANCILMSIIWLSECLHTPKYMAVFNLSIVDLSISTALIPKCLHQFLFDSRFVLYETCLTQMLFAQSLYGLESLSLVVMSYERLVSICFPLRSSTINTNTRMFVILAFCWVISFTYFGVAVGFITRLAFCEPIPVIKSYFCDHGPVFRAACNDNSANLIIGKVYTVLFIFLPFALIILSYVCIIAALSRIASAQGRWKAFKTCTGHLALVVIFFIPVLVTYMIAWINFTVETNTRILNTSLSATLPPLLNPIIYTLKTEEVMEQIKNFIRKRKSAPINH